MNDLLGPEGERRARDLDADGDGASRRADFAIPVLDGRDTAYLAGNSLGLQPRQAVTAVHEVLDAWARRAVGGHVEGEHPWLPYHTELSAPAARLIGATEREAVVMNSLTVNLHLMMTTFYRPTHERYRIVVEHDAFPSDRYAVASQAALHGFDPGDAVVALRPAGGSLRIEPDDVARCLDSRDGTVAFVLLGAVNFRTGALLDIEAITRVVHDAGCLAGWDLAHAAGNVALRLHDWDVDFAVWCSYKYLNSGPGSLGGCFVHERHGLDSSLPRPAGWWGHDVSSRFAMPDRFAPMPGVEGWQLSNPPILSMAAVRASLEMFDEVGIDRLRGRSLRLTAFLEELLDAVAAERDLRIITPREPERRGAQLSIEVPDAGAVAEWLRDRHAVIVDERPPNIVRIAPAPLYNTFHDCWRAAVGLYDVLAGLPASAPVAQGETVDV